MCVCSSAGADVFVVEDVVGVWRCLVVGVGDIVDVCCCMLLGVVCCCPLTSSWMLLVVVLVAVLFQRWRGCCCDCWLVVVYSLLLLFWVWSLLHTGAAARAVAPQSGENTVTQR